MKHTLSLEDYLSIYTTAKKRGKTQIKMTQFLREHHYLFTSQPEIIEKCPRFAPSVEKTHSHLDFMILHNPNGKLDTTLAFGFHLIGVKNTKVRIYINDRYYETIEVPIGHETNNFRKIRSHYVFPNAMSYEQRKNWRAENNKVLAGRLPEEETSNFYKKWKPSIKIKIK